MNHTDLKKVRREIGVSKHIPITHLNSPSIFEARNGMLGSVLKISGIPFATETNEKLNHLKKLWHHALTMLDERFCIYETLYRRKENIELKGYFDNDFAKQLDNAYHEQFKSRSLYGNTIYLTLIYKGFTSGKVGKSLSFLKRLSDKAIKESKANYRKLAVKSLIDAIQQLKATLAPFKPSIIGENDEELGYSELLAFLSLFPNGGQPLQLKSAVNIPGIGNSFSNTQKLNNIYPEGNLAHYLSNKRIFFGRYIQFQGATDKDTHFGAILSIKRYSPETSSKMLDNLLHLDSEFILTNTFAIESREQSLSVIDRHEIKMRNVDDKAESQLNALHLARDWVAGGEITMGYHHNTLLLLNSSQTGLEKSIQVAIRCYAEAGIVAIKETLNQEPAFWAQMPTNTKYIARLSLITSENFVDFAPLHNYQTGFRDGNHLQSAVTLLETPSKTPLFFNYHVKGHKNNPSKGHALIIGGNDSGKTALMTFLDAQMNRYGGYTFYFDRDQGAKIYMLAISGHYSVLSPNYPKSICFNPFQLKDTPSTRKFLQELLMVLCRHDEQDNLTPEVIEELKKIIDYAFDKLAPNFRNLTNITKLLPIQFSSWSSLRRWLKGNGKYSDGEYAYIFDNEEDKLTLHTKMGFDMTHFLDNEPAHIRTPLLMYLFHRIKSVLTGERVSILLDEGWQYFIDPYFSKELEKLLPTLRKYNAHVVIATQSPSSILKSSIRSMMLDNIPTQIYFANPQAKEQEYCDGFNLTEREFEIIKNNYPSSRIFLYKQDKDSTLCQLNLNHLPEYLAILSGNAKSVAEIDELRAKYGEDAKFWLSQFMKNKEINHA